jgi:hypothetical protein
VSSSVRRWLTLVALVTLACDRGADRDDAARVATEDAVIAAVLTDSARVIAPGATTQDTLWLVPELDAALSGPYQVDAHEWSESWRGVLRDLPAEMVSDYLTAQRRTRRLAAPPVVPGRLVAFSPPWRELAAARELRWVVQVSRVGFDDARDSAVVHVSHTCGPLCGSERALLLERRAGRWSLAKTLSSAWR